MRPSLTPENRHALQRRWSAAIGLLAEMDPPAMHETEDVREARAWAMGELRLVDSVAHAERYGHARRR